MCNKKCSNWKNNIIEKTKSAANLNDSLRLMADEISSYYPGIKIWFTEKSGKRESFIVGAGKEQYISPKKYRLNNNYAVFIQDANSLKEEDKNSIVNICRMLIAK